MWSFSLFLFKIFFLIFDILCTCLFKKYIYLTWKSELLGSMHLISIIFWKFLIMTSSNLYPVLFSFSFSGFSIRLFDILLIALGESHLFHLFSWCFSLDSFYWPIFTLAEFFSPVTSCLLKWQLRAFFTSVSVYLFLAFQVDSSDNFHIST